MLLSFYLFAANDQRFISVECEKCRSTTTTHKWNWINNKQNAMLIFSDEKQIKISAVNENVLTIAHIYNHSSNRLDVTRKIACFYLICFDIPDRKSKNNPQFTRSEENDRDERNYR